MARGFRLIAVAGLSALAAPVVRAEDLKLVKAVIVTRHGIRVPYAPLEEVTVDVFSQDEKRHWFPDPKEWGADVIAALTPHAETVLASMGAYFREAVLGDRDGSFTIYSDVDSTKRDINTAISFFKGAFPNANVTMKDMYGPGSNPVEQQYIKYLMDQGQPGHGPCPISGDNQDLLNGETGGSLARVSEEQKINVMRMNDLLDCCKPELCEKTGNSSYGDKCTLMSLPTKWEGAKNYWEDFTGPLTVAAKLAEYIQLLYLNGMDWQKLVPGMTVDDLAMAMHMHEESMAIADDYWNSVNAGSEMLVHVAGTMEQAVNGNSAALKDLKSKPEDLLVYYAAHDINIYFLRRLLRLEWLTESFNPNQSPPGGFLLFELLTSSAPAKDGKPEYFVKVFFMSSSMTQQREATKLSAANPGSKSFAVIPRCASGPELSCPFEDFKKLVAAEMRKDCIKLLDPSFLQPNEDQPEGADGGVSPTVYWLTAVAAVVLGGALGAILTTVLGRRRSARTVGASGVQPLTQNDISLVVARES
eukprot:TRINITY_DN10679_c0_g2_i1.p1 TRINITY_DN10679_c0_g2~~TRINITY_DN10679_c0_g2_i1.p1  ORF type:complete len:530 (+),score=134.70 TRINITY_DN10679_c0_g2_i1:66-1655(+)